VSYFSLSTATRESELTRGEIRRLFAIAAALQIVPGRR